MLLDSNNISVYKIKLIPCYKLLLLRYANAALKRFSKYS